MYCDTPTWIIYLTRFTLVACAILVIVLMQKAEHDKSIKRVDSKTLRTARRFSFWAIALCVVGVLLTDGNPVAQLMLYVSTGSVLAVDIIAIINRPPSDGHEVFVASYMPSPLRRLFAILRRH